MKFTIIKRYLDSQLKRVLNVGDKLELTDLQRARQLQAVGIIDKDIVIAEVKPKKKRGRPKAPQPPKDRTIREGETPEPPKNDKAARG